MHNDKTNSEALEELVTAHQAALFRYACLRLGSRPEAEDAVQETFLKLFGASIDLHRIDNPRAYLFRMVANACCDRLRRRKHRTADIECAVSVADEELPPNEEYARIAHLLELLPPEQAEVILLKTVENARFTEIADITGCPVTTVKSRFKYGVDKLRILLNH